MLFMTIFSLIMSPDTFLNISVVDAVIFTSAKGVVFCSSVGCLSVS